MNKIFLNNVEIVKIWTADTSKGPAVNLSLRDVIGTHPVNFRVTFWGQDAIKVQQSLTVGDYIDITGNMWIKSFKSQTGKDYSIAVIENPTDLSKLSLHTHIDLSDPPVDPPRRPCAEENEEDDVPF